jgi:DNA adenine methylase
MYHADANQPGQPGGERVQPRRLTALPRPFLRWAGSKQALLPRLSAVLPATFGRYYEPFVGAGALFFYLSPKQAVLSDASSELIDTWSAVKSNVEDLVNYLQPLRPERGLYYKIREGRSSDKVIRAGEFLYLNKTCWNGLYRVNANGKFNVPYGAPRTDFIFDEANIRACSRALNRSGIELKCCDFADAVIGAEGDLVYFDPPYVTTHNNNGFRDWNEKLFRWDDQVRLSEEAERLRLSGVKVVVSNAKHKDIIALYPNFSVVEFERSSTLSSSPRYRGSVGEILLSANT